MSLHSLVDPASTALWRISFAIVAGGGVALALVRSPAPTGLGAAAYVAAVVLYVLIALVAGCARHGRRDRRAGPTAAGGGGAAHHAGVSGVNVAWLLLFDEAPPPVWA
jgi:hypothetical protein